MREGVRIVATWAGAFKFSSRLREHRFVSELFAYAITIRAYVSTLSPQLFYLRRYGRPLKKKIAPARKQQLVAAVADTFSLARKVGCTDKHFFTMSSLLHSYVRVVLEGRRIVPLWFTWARGKKCGSLVPPFRLAPRGIER